MAFRVPIHSTRTYRASSMNSKDTVRASQCRKFDVQKDWLSGLCNDARCVLVTHCNDKVASSHLACAQTMMIEPY